MMRINTAICTEIMPRHLCIPLIKPKAFFTCQKHELVGFCLCHERIFAATKRAVTFYNVTKFGMDFELNISTMA